MIDTSPLIPTSFLSRVQTNPHYSNTKALTKLCPLRKAAWGANRSSSILVPKREAKSPESSDSLNCKMSPSLGVWRLDRQPSSSLFFGQGLPLSTYKRRLMQAQLHQNCVQSAPAENLELPQRCNVATAYMHLNQ